MLAFNNFLRMISKSEHSGANLCRIAIGVVFIWIGLLKFIPYESESITPFVANSPFMSFFYEYPEEYKSYLNHEGELISKNKAWHKLNNTYGYSNGLGIVEIIFAIFILANFKFPLLGLVGAIMAFLTPFITYSFLVFTPETWVQNMGDLHYGFPYLSGAGRLVLKDIMMSACGYVAMIDSAKTLLANRR
ncbi:reactive chlorine resistance membrane protein RclC [Aeromonas sp. JL9]|uniref:reactive chlorine resistance membrane protein RclC n=1 Tax=Aeromonas sp. JL9 TaxID=2950549 RepID=UPI00210B2BB9|nr:reactive chlorine resistance membrane protein RclC [Aeromonas sp. JL9]MCQ4111429.1 reactive chlorine resistance membrane protein RclC [Aeromonas sp. JL9]